MEVKDLRIDSGLGTHINDGSIKYAPGDKVPQTERKTFSSSIELQSMGKLDTQVSRPCAIIGPDRVLPPTSSSSEGYGKTGPEDLWPCPDIYHQLYELPLKMSDYPPPRNISPRQTYQENMQRIMVPPTYSSFKNNDEHSLKNTKLNMPTEAKYCDVPFNINNEHKAIRNSDISVSNVNQPFTRNIPGNGWQGLSVRPLRPYPAPEFYQYPDYSNLTGPRQMPMVRPQRSVHEESAQVYPERLYQDANLRFKPYPTVKDRYPHTRYEYIGSCPNSYPPPPSYPPHKSLQNHPYPIYPQVPLKYLERRIPEPIIDGFQRPSNPHPNMNTFRNHIPPPYGPIPNNCYQNKSYPYQSDNTKPVQLNKFSYESNNRVYLDLDNCRSKMYPHESFYYTDRSQIIRGDIVMPGQPPVNSVPQHQMYRKDNTLLKNYDYAPHYRNIDQTSINNSSLSRLPVHFSPNAIAISPCDSNTSNETAQTLGTLQEDCGYVSQSSTTSLKSFDTDIYRRHDYPNMTSLHGQTHNSELGSKSSSNKKGMNLRQFLQMWNEGDEDADNNNKEISVQKNTNFPTNSEEQLYVLGLVNVPNEELAKYDHLQKLSKLPENIKGYNYIELLNQYEQIVESPSFNNTHGKSIPKKEYPMLTKNLNTKMNKEFISRPLSPLDVEAKISQSVIHKEVGCNFEIKPCSPKLLNVDIATPVTDLMTERLIEKVTNPVVINIANVENSVDSVPPSCNLSNKQYSVETIKSNNYNLQDLETNTSICLASLPQLDNDIELNFPEVNQQFINSTKTDMSLSKSTTLQQHNPENKADVNSFSDSLTQVTNNPSSDKESSKLSKYRKTKKIELPMKESELTLKEIHSPSGIQQRIDSVIIKNPDNNSKVHINDNNLLQKNNLYNDTNENVESPKNCYSTYLVNTEGSEVCYDNLPSETAIDFSLNKNEHNLSESDHKISNDKYDTSLTDRYINNLNESKTDTKSVEFDNKNETKCLALKNSLRPDDKPPIVDLNEKGSLIEATCDSEKYDCMGAKILLTKSKEKNKHESVLSRNLININEKKASELYTNQMPEPINKTEGTISDSSKYENCIIETPITYQELSKTMQENITDSVQNSTLIDKNEMKSVELNKIIITDPGVVQETESVFMDKCDNSVISNTINQLRKTEEDNISNDVSNGLTNKSEIKSVELYNCQIPHAQENTETAFNNSNKNESNINNTTISQLSNACKNDTGDFIENGSLTDKNEKKVEAFNVQNQPDSLVDRENKTVTISFDKESSEATNITQNYRYKYCEMEANRKHTRNIEEPNTKIFDSDTVIMIDDEKKGVLNKHQIINKSEEHENEFLMEAKGQEQSCILLNEASGLQESLKNSAGESNILINSLSASKHSSTCESSTENNNSKTEQFVELGSVCSPSSKVGEKYNDIVVEPELLDCEKLEETFVKENESLVKNISPKKYVNLKEDTVTLQNNCDSEASYHFKNNSDLQDEHKIAKASDVTLSRDNLMMIDNSVITSYENTENNTINTILTTNVSSTTSNEMLELHEIKESKFSEKYSINLSDNENGDMFSKETSHTLLNECNKCTNAPCTKNNKSIIIKEKDQSNLMNDKITAGDCSERENQIYEDENNSNTIIEQQENLQINSVIVTKDIPKSQPDYNTSTFSEAQVHLSKMNWFDVKLKETDTNDVNKTKNKNNLSDIVKNNTSNMDDITQDAKNVEMQSEICFSKIEVQNFKVLNVTKHDTNSDTANNEKKNNLSIMGDRGTNFTYQYKNDDVVQLHENNNIPKPNTFIKLKQSKELYSPWIQKLLINTEGESYYNIHYKKSTKNNNLSIPIERNITLSCKTNEEKRTNNIKIMNEKELNPKSHCLKKLDSQNNSMNYLDLKENSKQYPEDLKVSQKKAIQEIKSDKITCISNPSDEFNISQVSKAENDLTSDYVTDDILHCKTYENINTNNIKIKTDKELNPKNHCLKMLGNHNDNIKVDLKENLKQYPADLKVSQKEAIQENTPDEYNISEVTKAENELISDNICDRLENTSRDKVTSLEHSISTNRKTLKRSLSESALETYSENEDSRTFFSKRPKLIQANFCSIFQSNRRNSISDICNEDSVYILIDNDYVISEEDERDKVCFTDVVHIDSNIETNNESIHAFPETSLNDNYALCDSPSLVQNIEEKTVEETWVDGDCIETMFNGDIAEDIIISAPGSPDNSVISYSDTDDMLHCEDVIEHMEKVKDIYGGNMCNNDAQLVETLYKTPQMNVNKTLVNIEYPDMELISLEDLNCNTSTAEFSCKNLNISFKEPDTPVLTTETETKDLHISFKKTYEIVNDKEYFEAESISDIDNTIKQKDDTKSNITFYKNDGHTVNSQTRMNSNLKSNEQNKCSPKHCMSSSPEVTSTTSEERNSSIMLKISNYKSSRFSRINEDIDNKKISYKLTESDHYKSFNTNYSSAGVLITKAAQKYIPPIKETISNLKVKLPLPQHSLNKLKELKKSKVEPKISKKLPIPSDLITRHDIVKTQKPKFEDVLMNIDKIQLKKCKEKLKKVKDEIPKVVIKKNESGAHYASSSNINDKNKYNPDLTGRKWQPWVFLEKNIFIDKMAIKNKQNAIYCHRKRAFVLAEKFRKYKSVYNAKFVISQPKSNDKTKGNLKYTIRLKTK